MGGPDVSSDIEIARQVKLRPIGEIAEKCRIPEESLHTFGHHKAKIDLDYLYKNNLVKYDDLPLKVLSKGELNKSFEISAHYFSKTAIKKIEDSGGKAIFV